jgi:hypothetical protein
VSWKKGTVRLEGSVWLGNGRRRSEVTEADGAGKSAVMRAQAEAR